MTKSIKLTRGFSTLVDDENYEWLSKIKWRCSIGGYALSGGSKAKNQLRMHRLIMNAPDGMDVDHINHDKLDNRKENLRICTGQQNNANRNKYKNTTSIFKGVFLTEKYCICAVQHNKKTVFRKYFTNEIAAANAYNYYAQKYHGEFALLNEVKIMKKEEWEKFITERSIFKYKYISWDKESLNWKCSFVIDSKRIFVGRFISEDKAVEEYNKKCIELGLYDRIQVIKGD